jgi:membrane protease YdiL (CAAX protease family)
MSGSGRRVLVDAGVGIGLVGYHAAVHGRGEPHHRVGLNLAAATVAVAVGAASGLTPAAMGIAPGDVRHGVLVGVLTAAPIVGGLAGVFGNPRSRGLLHDARVEGLPPRVFAFQAGVRIPFETALAEEVLFRGVFDAWLRRDGASPVYATLVGAAVFGLWHIPPGLASLDRTAAGARVGATTAGRATAVLGTVASTAVAGIGFTIVRRRGHSVVASAIVHAAVNATGLAGAWLAARRREATA